MSRFFYTAKQGPRKVVEGTVEAAHLEEAVAKIVQMGLAPLDVHSAAEARRSAAGLGRRLPFLNRRISEIDLMLLTRKASDLTDAGVPVLQMLRIIERQERREALREILSKVADYVKDGASFSDALARYDQAFPKVYINMIRAGEMGGNLNDILRRLADLMEQDQDTRAQVKNSLVYPAVILVVAMLTIAAIFTFVIPRIMVIFQDLNQELPPLTKIIMGISYVFQNFGWVFVLLIIGVGVYIHRLWSTLAGKLWLDRMMLRVPVVGDFIKVAEIGRFARSFGALMESGVAVVKSLEAVALVMDNDFLREEVQGVARQVSNGTSLTDALRAHPIFPELAVGMVSVAEESGFLAKGLYKLADYYERQTQRAMKRVASLVEPALILVLGVVVAFILAGTLLPIMQMNLMVQ